MGATTPLWTVFVTAGAALLGGVMGGWFAFFRDKRAWLHEHEKHWQETRLETYKEFLTAHREYLAYVMLDTTRIEARMHPRLDEMMPFFDADGRPVRQRQEAAFTALRLVTLNQETEAAMVKLVTSARQIACARAEYDPKSIHSDLFAATSRYEQEFINAARRELGLAPLDRVFESRDPSEAETILGAIPGETMTSATSVAVEGAKPKPTEEPAR